MSLDQDLAALVAPGGLLNLDNTDFVRLSPVTRSSYGCGRAARTAYMALEVEDNLGFVQQGGHPLHVPHEPDYLPRCPLWQVSS